MSIEIECTCGKRYRTGDEMGGRRVKCKACGATIKVPRAEQLEHADPFASPPSEYEVSGGSEEGSEPVQHDALSAMMVDQSTVASNPGRTRIDFVHYLTCYPTDLIVAAIGLVVGVGGALWAWHPVPLIFAAVGLWLLVQGLLRQRAKFVGGDVCPAVVISDKPYRIAVCTDLSTGHTPRPAILILRAPLSRMTGGPPSVGQRLATVALYAGVASEDAWRNFDPTVLACATRNEADIARVTASIPQSQWGQLYALLGRLPDQKDGLYKLWLGTKNQYMGQGKQRILAAIILVAIAAPIIAVIVKGVDKRKSGLSSGSLSETEKSPARPVPKSSPRLAPAVGGEPTVPSSAPNVGATDFAARARERAEKARVDAEARRAARRNVPSVAPEVPAASQPIAVAPAPASAPAPEVEPARPAKPSAASTQPAKKVKYAVGDKLEIMEKSGKWTVGSILKVDGRRYYIGYDGWSEAWNEWVSADRLRPLPVVGGDFAVGDKIEIFENRRHWSPGVVLKKEGRRYFVHYDGFSDSWNEWVDPDQVRARP